MGGFLASAGIQDHDMSEAKGNVHQRHPKWKYHRTGKSIIVQNSDAETALGEGWGDSPAGPFIPQDADPLHWFDKWELESLSDEAKQRIRKGLADAHAAVIDSSPEAGSSVRDKAVQAAFDLFCQEYMAAGLLTESIMEESIPEKVYDAACSGHWQTGTPEKNSRYTLQFGHYWVPPDVPQMLKVLLQAQMWRWRGSLKAQAPHPSARPSVATDPMADPGLAGDSAIALAEQRRRVVAPILKDKRWTTSRWATQAGVSKNSAYEYLAGKRQLREENRKALAEVLDLKPEALPQ